MQGIGSGKQPDDPASVAGACEDGFSLGSQGGLERTSERPEAVLALERGNGGKGTRGRSPAAGNAQPGLGGETPRRARVIGSNFGAGEDAGDFGDFVFPIDDHQVDPGDAFHLLVIWDGNRAVVGNCGFKPDGLSKAFSDCV